MAQMTWRSDDELLERVKRAAEGLGRSMNEYVTTVLDAATNPDLAGTEAERLRERLEQAGLSVPRGRRRRPAAAEVARARSAAGRGRPLSDLVSEDR
jgi:hypothetical protein